MVGQGDREVVSRESNPDSPPLLTVHHSNTLAHTSTPRTDLQQAAHCARILGGGSCGAAHCRCCEQQHEAQSLLHSLSELLDCCEQAGEVGRERFREREVDGGGGIEAAAGRSEHNVGASQLDALKLAMRAWAGT